MKRLLFVAGFLMQSSPTPAKAAVPLGPFAFDDQAFGTEWYSNRGFWQVGSLWINVLNAKPDVGGLGPIKGGSTGIVVGSNFDTGLWLYFADHVTIYYKTPILNRPGNDFGLVVTSDTTTDGYGVFRLSVKGGSPVDFAESLLVHTGVSRTYYYTGSGPYPRELLVLPVDLSAFGIPEGGSAAQISLTSFDRLPCHFCTSPVIGLIRIAGFADRSPARVPALSPPILALLMAFLVLLGVVASVKQSRNRSASLNPVRAGAPWGSDGGH